MKRSEEEEEGKEEGDSSEEEKEEEEEEGEELPADSELCTPTKSPVPLQHPPVIQLALLFKS